MDEKVGQCAECNQAVYCKAGFLDGVYQDGKLLCASCDDKKE
ncbi:hypothetical protein [Gracilibacillus kekensis]|uniref:Uncharacterized protein n=1 Tax=Gracilibacillus kekensis TaxID=1027249 RepID=A0A1M7P2G9_9BACI|nr:hypothetical protein [Gracilibacillus kekensis]SHN10730.1 hypothetical protein SAMN05216179_1927 [Gracilibacillus kekensis]